MSKPFIDQYLIPIVLKKDLEGNFTLMSKFPLFEGEEIEVKTSIHDKNKYAHVIVEISECRPSKGVWEGETPYVTNCKLQKI